MNNYTTSLPYKLLNQDITSVAGLNQYENKEVAKPLEGGDLSVVSYC